MSICNCQIKYRISLKSSLCELNPKINKHNRPFLLSYSKRIRNIGAYKARPHESGYI